MEEHIQEQLKFEEKLKIWNRIWRTPYSEKM